MQHLMGYGVGTTYTFNYFRELNPLFAEAALVHAGFVPRPSFHACELGFGLGLSAAIHAGASGLDVWGNDFSAAQVAIAREIAPSGTQDRLSEQAFATFCARPDLPDFDFIGAHGVWTCMSDENRRIILDFVARKLRVGGVFYVSYNTKAGWASVEPLRQLLRDHVAVMSASGIGELAALKAALEFARTVLNANCAFAGQNPRILAILDGLIAGDLQYAAHEYLTEHWSPSAFRDMAQLMASAQLDYGCSARLTDAVPGLDLLPEHATLLGAIPDPTFREAVRDLLVGQSFRRDYWVKGRRRAGTAEREAAVAALRFVMVEPPNGFLTILDTRSGPITLPRSVFEPVIAALSDHQPHSLAEIAAATRSSPADAASCVFTLVEIGAVQPAQASDDAVCRSMEGAAAVNAALIRRGEQGGKVPCLASPVTGGGCRVDPDEMAALVAETGGGTRLTLLRKLCPTSLG